MADPAADDADEPGDPVCWLHRLCPECGAMPSEDDPDGPCWRCGTPPLQPPEPPSGPGA